MITYFLTLSQVFPATHPKAGSPTGFKESFLDGQNSEEDGGKLHTIRANYEFWRKRFDKIEKGEACLSVRMWTGKPYRSKMIELCRLTKEDGIGLQKLEIVAEKYRNRSIWLGYVDGNSQHYGFFQDLAKNDGLKLQDWFDWFKNYKLNEPMAIIHFTHLRYIG